MSDVQTIKAAIARIKGSHGLRGYEQGALLGYLLPNDLELELCERLAAELNVDFMDTVFLRHFIKDFALVNVFHGSDLASGVRQFHMDVADMVWGAAMARRNQAHFEKYSAALVNHPEGQQVGQTICIAFVKNAAFSTDEGLVFVAARYVSAMLASSLETLRTVTTENGHTAETFLARALAEDEEEEDVAQEEDEARVTRGPSPVGIDQTDKSVGIEPPPLVSKEPPERSIARIEIACPSCQEWLAVPNSPGQLRVTCGHCQHIFVWGDSIAAEAETREAPSPPAPSPPLAPKRVTKEPKVVSPPSQVATKIPPQKAPTGVSFEAVMGLLILAIGLTALLWYSYSPRSQAPQLKSEADTYTQSAPQGTPSQSAKPQPPSPTFLVVPPSSDKVFSLGSTKADVLRIQGMPDTIFAHQNSPPYYDTWSYYSSGWVYIEKGVVVGWEFHAPEKLRVGMKVGPEVGSSPFVTVGSHIDDVIRLCGTPNTVQPLAGSTSVWFSFADAKWRSVSIDREDKRVDWVH